MGAAHLELLVEEPSMEAFLCSLLPRLLPEGKTFQVHAFRGKRDLFSKLQTRLQGYAAWLPDDWRIIVVVDRDEEDCKRLKHRMEEIAREAGLRSRTRSGPRRWQLVNRIAIEELEAWYFGDWQAVRAAYPDVSGSTPNQARYRDPDAIKGGTWEAFERIMKKHGYFPVGLGKIEAARTIGRQIDPARNRSRSFRVFRDAVLEAVR